MIKIFIFQTPNDLKMKEEAQEICFICSTCYFCSFKLRKFDSKEEPKISAFGKSWLILGDFSAGKLLFLKIAGRQCYKSLFEHKYCIKCTSSNTF